MLANASHKKRSSNGNIMTNDQEHLVTLLFIKYGGFREVVDTWLYADDKLSTDELEAMNAWLAIEQNHRMELVKESKYQYVTVEIDLD